MDYSISDICPYISDYVAEVEENGNEITPEVVMDILGDFAEIPADVPDPEALISELAHKYCGR